MQGQDADLTSIRMRTKDGLEFITIPQGDYTLVTIQNCRKKRRRRDQLPKAALPFPSVMCAVMFSSLSPL